MPVVMDTTGEEWSGEEEEEEEEGGEEEEEEEGDLGGLNEAVVVCLCLY